MIRPLSALLLLCALPAAALATPCGNGTVDSGEACDDGNQAAADGCSATCTVEEGFRCNDAGAVNLLVNGDFENGTTGWTTDATIGTGAYALDGEVRVTATPYSYVNATCVSGSCLEGNLGGVVWRQTVTLTPSTEYRFTAFAAVRTDGGGSATARLSLRVDGTAITPVFDKDGPPPAPWHTFGGTFTTAANQTSAVLEVHNAYLGSAGNNFNLDELALVRAPSTCAPASGPDAGTQEPDAGTQEPDAGTQEPDAGTQEPDAGAQEPDAGAGGEEIVDDGGCGCGGASSGWFAAVLAGLACVARPRRRAASRGL